MNEALGPAFSCLYIGRSPSSEARLAGSLLLCGSSIHHHSLPIAQNLSQTGRQRRRAGRQCCELQACWAPTQAGITGHTDDCLAPTARCSLPANHAPGACQQHRRRHRLACVVVLLLRRGCRFNNNDRRRRDCRRRVRSHCRRRRISRGGRRVHGCGRRRVACRGPVHRLCRLHLDNRGGRCRHGWSHRWGSGRRRHRGPTWRRETHLDQRIADLAGLQVVWRGGASTSLASAADGGRWINFTRHLDTCLHSLFHVCFGPC